MTESCIIWRGKIWVKYIVRAFWQNWLSYVERILKIKDSILQRLKSQCDWINNNLSNYYWSRIKLNIVEMSSLDLSTSHLSWRNRWDPNKVNEQDKRLTTQVVFTAAIVKIPFTCLSYLGLLSLSARLCALSLGLSALESSLKERAVEQGVTRPTCPGSLFLIFHTNTTLTIQAYVFKDEDLGDNLFGLAPLLN